jgi:acyl-coenzyme A synthetase/AMP-(fatty) acid ligase
MRTVHHVAELPPDDEPIPLGEPIRNAELIVLREDGREANAGEEGEVHVRGAVVFKGYWGDPEQTARVLVPDPRDPHRVDPLFRSGDMVRRDEDDRLVFVGRRDQQIKSRGFRIELGEVESALSSHPAVSEAAAVAVPHPEWQTVIVGFVRLKAEGAQEADLKAHVADRLPRYMVPERIETVDEMPRTSTGKIDRPTLAASGTLDDIQ